MQEKEQIEQLSINAIDTFNNHPFSIGKPDEMLQMEESIQSFGVINPVIVRPIGEGRYEMVSGHRRLKACEELGLKTIPALVRELGDDAAIIAMVDSNLQRENILPSEKAKAYQMKLDAIKRQGARNDLTSVHSGQKLKNATSREILAESSPDGATQIQRYIRLNKLDKDILQLVDEGKMGLTPAVQISFLTPEEQEILFETMQSEQCIPSYSQAKRMRELSEAGNLNDDALMEIMVERKKPESLNITIPVSKVRRFFPSTYSSDQIAESILKILAQVRARKREQER